MDYITVDEAYELQYGDDLDALSELEHSHDHVAQFNEEYHAVRINRCDTYTSVCSSPTYENNTFKDSVPSSGVKRNICASYDCSDLAKEAESKRFKFLKVEQSTGTKASRDTLALINEDLCETHGPDYFPLTITKFDGTRAYLKLYEDDCHTQAKDVSVSSNSIGLLQTSIAELKADAFRKLDTSYNVSDQTLPDVSGFAAKNDEKSDLWVEKYRPRSFVELLSDEGINRTLLRWLKLWDKVVFGREKKCHLKLKRVVEKNLSSKFSKYAPELSESLDEHGRPLQKIVLLCGPPGLGKTTLANVIAELAGYNVVELNASDDRSPEIFRRSLEAATQMKAILDKKHRPNCLVIDEIDGAPAPSINVLVSFVKSLGSSKGKQKKGDIPILLRPIICICNDQYATALKPLRQVSLILNFPPTSKNRLVSRLSEVAVAEGLKTDPTPLIILCEKADNDIRSCLSTIQFLFNLKKDLCIADLKKLELGIKDVHKSLFSIWQSIFYAPKLYLWSDVLKSTQAFGDCDKIFIGMFENYLRVKIKTARLETISKGADWLGFADILQKEIYQHQLFFLMSYLPFTAVAFHLLFATPTFPQLSYPSPYYEFLSKRAKLSSGLSSVTSEIVVCLKNFFKASNLVLDILPLLVEIIKPSLRPVNTQLYSNQEKLELKRVIDVMVSFNLSYIQERSVEGNYRYILEPNIEELVQFNCAKQRKELGYSIKQLISREVSLEKMRRNEVPESTVVQQCSEKNLKTYETPIIAKKPCTDFFGRKIESAKTAPIVQVECKDNESSGDVWFHFKEGYSNAVRRVVYVKDIL